MFSVHRHQIFVGVAERVDAVVSKVAEIKFTEQVSVGQVCRWAAKLAVVKRKF